MPIGMPSIGDSGLPAFQRAVLLGRGARARDIGGGEGLHDRLARGDGFEAALEIGARSIAPSRKRAGASWKVSAL